MEKSASLLEAIDLFINMSRKVNRNNGTRKMVLHRLSEELSKNKPVMIKDLSGGRVNEELNIAVADTMSALQMNKFTIYEMIAEFFKYLNRPKGFNLNLRIEDYLEKPEKDNMARRIAILKSLHGRTLTLDNLVDQYSVSDRTIREDLNKIENGIEVLGNEIKIELNRIRNKGISYKTTVHPVVLMLNMTEVYALTVGLKKISKRTAYETVLNDLADYIYNQVSDYGKDLIDKTLRVHDEHTGIRFDNRMENSFRSEDEMLKNRKNRLVYFEKLGHACGLRITIDCDGEVEVIEGGRITSFGGQMIRIRHDNDERVVNMDQIINIERIIPRRNVNR